MAAFSGPTATMVAEFAALPFIRAALLLPHHPSSVLSFFLGFDCSNASSPSSIKTEFEQGDFLIKMAPYWFMGPKEYDQLCKPFSNVIRESGKFELVHDEEWHATVNGQLAQLILCDQLSRNCFRGTDEAYAYDDAALQFARRLTHGCILPTTTTLVQNSPLTGVLYPSCWTFCITAMMHSEDINDHETALAILEQALQTTPDKLQTWWTLQKKSLLEHTVVVKEFGRYPHRNAKKGRESTPVENEWLANVDALPGWAKSQL